MLKISELMKKYGIKPKHSLGQNFLINDAVLAKIIKASDLKPTDNVLEVGAGLGVLTRELIGRAKRVMAVEVDRSLIYVLKQTIGRAAEFRLIEADILKLPMREIEAFFKNEPYKIVANIPYQITSHFLRRFLEVENPPQKMVLLVQKEVAQRIVAKPGDMSLLALSAQFYSRPRIVDYVPAGNFLPAPDVDSAILELDEVKKITADERAGAKKMFRVARIGFSAKRKQLQNNLANGLGMSKEAVKNMLEEIGLDGQVRAQDLSVENWQKLVGLIGN
jgi:16S rRNA (adenine1518-N6/adenine1519-N6)-dimethyltransferase